VHENECLQCQNFHTSLVGWRTYSAEESDAFPVLFCTVAGSYISLNDVQMANNKHGRDTPHCDLSYIRNKCTLITYLFVICFILSMKFFAQLCRLAFSSFVSFCLLRGRQACIPTVNRRQQTVRALTLKPRCDSFVQFCLLVFFLSLLHFLTKIESSQAIYHICFLSAVNFLPPEIFLRILLTDETVASFFLRCLYKNGLRRVKFVLWHIFYVYNQLFSPIWEHNHRHKFQTARWLSLPLATVFCSDQNTGKYC